MADDSEARPGRGDFAGDNAKPHVVGAADFRIRQKIHGARAEEELDRQAVGCKAKRDDFRERFFRVVGASKLRVGEVEPVEDAQLLPFGSRRGGLVVAQGLRIVAGFVESRTFGDQRADREP